MSTLPASIVEDAMRRALADYDLSEAHAHEVATALVDTSLMGIDTHGVNLFPVYLRELRNGRANPNPQFAVRSEGTASVFFADDALGIVAGTAAMREAIARARKSGVSVLAVANSNHFGAAGHYARMAAACDQIGVVFSNSDALVVPYGGLVPLNGSNPIAIAAPAIENDGFFLDMATSEVSYSRLMREAEKAGEPHKRITLSPTGGYKGQGLGMMVQIFCALLAGMPYDYNLSHLYSEPYDVPRQISHFMMVLNIGAFVDPIVFRNRLSELLRTFRASQRSGTDAVIVAGDREAATRRKRLVEGIPLDPNTEAVLEPFLTR